MGNTGAELAQKKSKATNSKADPHQSEASADPRQKGSLRGEVNSRILLRRCLLRCYLVWLCCHARIVICKRNQPKL